MKPTSRLLLHASRAHHAPRAQTTAFVGLGRMGFEMAYNLFSRTLVESSGSAHFVVCDARQEAAEHFSHNLVEQFPGAKIQVVPTPAE